jgi:hypothetical protein
LTEKSLDLPGAQRKKRKCLREMGKEKASFTEWPPPFSISKGMLLLRCGRSVVFLGFGRAVYIIMSGARKTSSITFANGVFNKAYP